MITLLIVDDEPIERTALQRMVQEGMDDIVIVGQAANGREAIEAAARLKPDLITMDIKMPGIGGLQAIETITATDKQVKFIVVTAYDTFEFAQQALRLGVRDYLLKPSKTAVVLETIGRVADEIRASHRDAESRRKEQERLRRMLPVVEADIVSQLLFDFAPSVHLNEMIDLLEAPEMKDGFVMNVLLQDHGGSQEGAPGDFEALQLALAGQLEASSVHGWVGKASGKQIPLIIFKDIRQSYRQAAVGIGRTLVQALRRMTGAEPFIGIGGLYADRKDMRKSYHEALLASVDLSLPARFRLYEDLPHHELPASGPRVLELEKCVLEDVRRGHWESAVSGALRVIDVYETAGQPIGIAQQRIFEVLIVLTRMLEEMGYELDKPYYPHQTSGYMQLKTETSVLLGRLAEATALKAGDMESDLVTTMKTFIREHARENLSLERVAAEIDRNPFYVSKLFKSHFGMNYIDYLTECRMETAKQLMQDAEKSLKEITYEIGYHDPNYFSRVFKKIVGYSPTEYRKMLLRPLDKKLT
ncbi:response regulator [Paenibacillus sacheonensis]|uniref:Response regulator n=1 Tax=Paenibacillus sacheonensis TaxID=742054 RepID=A0A7X5C037_9BACL|nr:response regulator [Paenibacillus sacheonensis]MBM7563431.1 two-component system response regulator YesN [Paenibacillus sacheonensis]NBC68014.1 response regulator [Paenibacillus sacheonensis]